jgi:hypothetical protein
VPLLLGIVATGLMAGGGLMYSAMMTGALDEPSLTYAVLSALRQPAVPFFITLNSAMELGIVSLPPRGLQGTVPPGLDRSAPSRTRMPP